MVDITQKNITVGRELETSRNFIQTLMALLRLPRIDRAEAFELYYNPTGQRMG
jgi:hypothetical protein